MLAISVDVPVIAGDNLNFGGAVALLAIDFQKILRLYSEPSVKHNPHEILVTLGIFNDHLRLGLHLPS